MDISWLDAEHPDEGELGGVVALLEAARLADRPFHMSTTFSSHAALIRYGWDEDPPLAATARDARGRVVGYLQVWLPTWDNVHLGEVEVIVDPNHRRQGIGRELFEAGVDRLRVQERKVLLTHALDGPVGAAFAKTFGLSRASLEIQRRLDLSTVDWERVEREYTAAQQYAGGYDLIRLPGDTPEELVADVVALSAAINDAPTDDLDIEDEVFSAERLRAFEAGQRAHARRIYRLVARDRETGVLAGQTMVAIEREQPGYGWQYDTSVVRAHRGHRLGVILKIGMLHWLSEVEPQLRRMDTWNAASNAHMIRVNELLGYTIIMRVVNWQRHL